VDRLCGSSFAERQDLFRTEGRGGIGECKMSEIRRRRRPTERIDEEERMAGGGGQRTLSDQIPPAHPNVQRFKDAPEARE